MRRFITLGIKPDGSAKILHDADEEKSTHIDKFRGLAAGKKGKKKSDYAEVQVVDLSRGVIKRTRFGGFKDGGKRTIARTVKPKKRTVARTKGKAVKKKSATPKRRSRGSIKVPRVRTGDRGKTKTRGEAKTKVAEKPAASAEASTESEPSL